MEDSQKPPTEQDLEAEIVKIDETINSIRLEQKKILNDGGKYTLDRLHEISVMLRQGRPTPQEAQRLREERLLLWETEFYHAYSACLGRKMKAQEQRRNTMLALDRLKEKGAPSVAPLLEISSQEAKPPPYIGVEQGKVFSLLFYNLTFAGNFHAAYVINNYIK